MAEQCFPLENTLYTAEDAQLWLCTRTSGVYANGHLGVTANGEMNLLLGAGIAWLKHGDFGGCVYGNKSDLVLPVEMSDGQYDRIDRVCIRLEKLANKCYAYVKKGTAAASPVPPELQRDSLVYEISVAQVYVGAGVVAVNAGNITDERFNSAVCGLMRDGVTGIDTSVIQAQFEAALTNAVVKNQAAFDDWFANVQTTLDGDVAGNLLNRINGKVDGTAVTAIIPATGWQVDGDVMACGNVYIPGVTANNVVIVSPASASHSEYGSCSVRAVAQQEDSLTFHADATPSYDLTVNVLVLNLGVTV